MRRAFPADRPTVLPAILALLLASGGVLATPASTMAGPVRDQGVDISRWQLTIDWVKAGDSERAHFAILRADRGWKYVDPSYATNLAGATANGVTVGAYHRATPSAQPEDPVKEADHFLATARNAVGDIVPALDIEETGGLDPAGLRTWVRAWLARVEARTGLRAMLYASPHFWRTNMGNSTWFATHGFPLWIAHWGVAAPDVPADGWAGQGWTFWQWTNTGHVAGIPTNVDRDRYVDADVRSATIAGIDVEEPLGGTIVAERIRCGTGGDRCTRLANPGDQFTFTATPDDGGTFLGWSGACAAAGTSPTCTVTAAGARTLSGTFGFDVSVSIVGTGGGTVTSSPDGIDCGASCAVVFPAGSAVTLTATADSASVFDGWAGACAGLVATCVVTVDAPVVVTAAFLAAIQLEEDGPGSAFRWGTIADRRSLGGSYRADHLPGATAIFAFEGPSVTVFTVRGPSMGKGSIAIDDGSAASFDGYAPVFGLEARRFTDLGAGWHTVTVTALGLRRATATGTRVGVDAIRYGGHTHWQAKPIGGSWGASEDPGASGAAFVAADTSGATASLSFTGTGVTLKTAVGPRMGRAEIWVDGILVRTVDLYAPTRSFGILRTVTGLADAGHTALVVVIGTHRAASEGAAVVVDGWIVR